MRILIVGANGDVGQAVVSAFQDRHEIIKAGRKSGDVQVNMTDPGSVRRLFDKLDNIDAVVCAAGVVRFKSLQDHTPASIKFGLDRKLMGQINLVLFGMDKVNDGGSFTLTSGILDKDPIHKGIGASVANGGLNGFVKGAAIEMPRNIRINAIGPGLLDVSQKQYGHLFPGHDPVSSSRVGKAYAKSVEGFATGKVIRVE